MKKPILFTALALFLLAISSCGRLTDGVVKTIDMPPHVSKLAPSLFLDTRDSSIVVTVSATQGIYDTASSSLVDDAVCRLLKDGVEQYRWTTQDFNGNYEEVLPAAFGPQEGLWTLEVSHPDFETVTAEQRFPEKAIAELQVDYGATQMFNEISDRLRITLKDRPDVNQHYLVWVDLHFRTPLTGQDTSVYYELWPQTEQPNVQTLFGNNKLNFLISENGVDQDLVLDLATGVNPVDFLGLHEYRVNIATLSDAQYRFYLSYQDYENASNNPFAEPVILYSNTSSQAGCFGTSTSIRKWR